MWGNNRDFSLFLLKNRVAAAAVMHNSHRGWRLRRLLHYRYNDVIVKCCFIKIIIEGQNLLSLS